MTLTALLADCYRRLRFTTTPPSDVTTRLTAFLNEALQDVAGEPGISAWIARNEPMSTFASVANQAVYAVPMSSARIDAVTERTTQRRLMTQSRDWYRSAYPDPTIITGTPDSWVPFGFQAVQTQPPAASALYAFCDGTGNATAYVETIRTNGYTYSGSAMLNPLLPGAYVQFGALTDHIEVTKFYLSGAIASDVTITDAVLNPINTFATIPAGQTFARYQSFALAPTPSAAITYYLESERTLPAMVNGTDEPPIPEQFHRLLTYGALLKEWTVKDDTRRADAEALYRKVLSDFRYFVTCPPDFLPLAGRRGARVERSRLGGWFPDGAGS